MNRPTDVNQPRAEGPAEVRKGPLEVAAVVVLDPSGDGKHGGLPATWRPLTDDIGVVWCRLPAIRRQRLAGDQILRQLADGRQRIHLVGIGSSGLLAVALAMANRDLVRSLIVVDPPWPSDDLAELNRFVDSGSLITRQIQTPDAALPIGHPDVVSAIVQVLVETGADLPDPPEHPGLADQALHAVRDRISEALESFADELGDRGLR
jgi:pimeloyl-ACP methyl ester carboxylesterase